MQIGVAKWTEGFDEGEVVGRIAAGSGFTTQGEYLETMAHEHLSEPYATRDGKFWACRETGEMMGLVPIHSGSAS